jgi:hypothetical protein
MTTTYFYTYIIVYSNISISKSTYIASTFNIAAQTKGLGYVFLVVSFKQPKWFFLGGAATTLLGGGLHYTFMDP